ncbi:MAG: helix-turn-helix domain-containing protein [Bacteroidota bacterium]
MTEQILFLFASLGVVNGTLVGFYLLFRKHCLPADRYFGALLLAICIRIGKSILYYFNRDTDLLVLQIGLSACIFIGPLFFLYLKSLRFRDKVFRRNDLILLATLGTAIIAVGIIYPYRSFPEVWNGYIIYGIYATWMLFLILGLIHGAKLLSKSSLPAQPKKGNSRYLLAIIVAMCFITLTYQAALFVGFTYIWGSLIFSLSFYYLAGRMLLSTKPLTPRNIAQPLTNASELMRKVDQLMVKEKPFMSKGLKLEELAEMAGMSKHLLSRLLNEAYQHGFAHYVKTHRVKEAKQLIQSRPELSLEGIGYEAGFSSKSAFFEAFRKIEMCTPAVYKKSLNGQVKLQSTPE